MTTYYGVWSDWSGRNGKEWWRSNSGLLFRTTFLPVALAQAEVSNAIWKRGPAYGTRKDERWEARAIGEDGLPISQSDLLPPTSERPRAAAEFETHPERHPCAMCGKPAKEWKDVHVGCRVCEGHKGVDAWLLSWDALRKDGLPTIKPSLTEEQKRIRSEAASHKCVLCGKPALGWTFAYVKGWMCERHMEMRVCCPAEEEP